MVILRNQIAEKFGITSEQAHNFIKRHNKKLQNIEAGILPKKKVVHRNDELLRKLVPT